MTMYTNKLITINYKQFLLYSERKVIIYKKINDLVGYEIQCFFISWNSPERHLRKIPRTRCSATVAADMFFEI